MHLYNRPLPSLLKCNVAFPLSCPVSLSHCSKVRIFWTCHYHYCHNHHETINFSNGCIECSSKNKSIWRLTTQSWDWYIFSLFNINLSVPSWYCSLGHLSVMYRSWTPLLELLLFRLGYWTLSSVELLWAESWWSGSLVRVTLLRKLCIKVKEFLVFIKNHVLISFFYQLTSNFIHALIAFLPSICSFFRGGPFL